MRIGVPKEVKNRESRVGLVPSGIKALRDAGHHVMVEADAGVLSSFSNDDYRQAGAEIGASARDVWSWAETIVKVKEPIECEYQFFREGLVLFTYWSPA